MLRRLPRLLATSLPIQAARLLGLGGFGGGANLQGYAERSDWQAGNACESTEKEDCKMQTIKLPKPYNAIRWERCVEAFQEARAVMLTRDETIRDLDKRYGTKGEYNRLSGGACESWHPMDRAALRLLNDEFNAALDLAFSLKPHRARISTARRLWSYLNP
jgi:hypothetical protein